MKRAPLFGKPKESPGPGAHYNPEMNSSFRSTNKISLRALLQSKIAVTPGPGHYKPLTAEKPTEYSFCKDKKYDPFCSKSETPPPCQYDLHSQLSERSVVIGTSKRKRLLQTEMAVPGPGTYKPVLKPFKSTEILIRFPKASRQAQRNKPTVEQPGPGTYDTRSMFEGQSRGSTAGPTMSTRFEDTLFKKRMSIPGPGAYPIKLIPHEASTQKFSFPRSGRSLVDFFEARTSVHSNTDFYDYHKHPDKRIKMKFSKQQRLKLVQSPTRRIGPGDYDNAVRQILKLKQTSPLFSISKERRKILELPKDVVESPGPAVHTLAAIKDQAISLARSERPEYSRRAGPGPGAYTPAVELKKSLDIRFARSCRPPNKIEEFPGPGTYEIPVDFAVLPSYV